MKRELQSDWRRWWPEKQWINERVPLNKGQEPLLQQVVRLDIDILCAFVRAGLLDPWDLVPPQDIPYE